MNRRTPPALGGLEHPPGGVDVVLPGEGVACVAARREADDGGEVVHDVDAAQEIVDVDLGDVPTVERERRLREEGKDGVASEEELVDDAHLVAIGEERRDEHRADVAGPSGDQGTHW